MSDRLRTEGSRAIDAATDADRDAKIEQLLLVGLDQYFAAQYDQAINVWTRVLFLDRSHARARAYIERARSAQAERQRESEELLQTGVAAFRRGDGEEARRLLQAALDGGAPPDEALPVLNRLNHHSPSGTSQAARAQGRERRRMAESARRAVGPVSPAVVLEALGFAVVVAVVSAAIAYGPIDWRGLLGLRTLPLAAAKAPVTAPPALALPTRAERSLARARTFAAQGRLQDALGLLEGVRSTDPQKADADRLRGEIQRQLLSLSVPPPREGASTP